MTMTVLDLENARAYGAKAILRSKRLGVRLVFDLEDSPPVKVLSTVGRGNDTEMVPEIMVVEYSKRNQKAWEITVLRVYGHSLKDPERECLNVYMPEGLRAKPMEPKTPSWIRDAAEAGKPA